MGCLGVEDKAIPWNEIFAWEVMQGERKQNLGVDNKKFCKAHKSMRICETLINVAKWSKKERELAMCIVVKKE